VLPAPLQEVPGVARHARSRHLRAHYLSLRLLPSGSGPCLLVPRPHAASGPSFRALGRGSRDDHVPFGTGMPLRHSKDGAGLGRHHRAVSAAVPLGGGSEEESADSDDAMLDIPSAVLDGIQLALL
jgi:hypothetical protein